MNDKKQYKLSETRREQMKVASVKTRQSLLKQYTGGGSVVYSTKETKQAIKVHQHKMGYSKIQYAYDDILMIGLNEVRDLSKEAIQKKLKEL